MSFGPVVDDNYLLSLDFRVKADKVKDPDSQTTSATAKTNKGRTPTARRSTTRSDGVKKPGRPAGGPTTPNFTSGAATERPSAMSQSPASASQVLSVLESTVPPDTKPTMNVEIEPRRSTPYSFTPSEGWSGAQ
jgi:hypothetical protein